MKTSNSYTETMMEKVSQTNRRSLIVLVLFLLMALLVVSFASMVVEAAPAPSFVDVTTDQDLLIGGCDDNDPTTECSLRDAIVVANSSQRLKKITLPDLSDGSGVTTFILTIQGSDEDAAKQGDLDIKKDLEIVGQGPGKTIIVGMGDRVMEVLPNVSVKLTNLSIQGGGAADDGGGIRNRGTLTIVNSVLSGNTAGGNGGAISSEDSVSITRSAIVNNSAGGSGGAIYVANGSVSLNNSTISGNSAVASGGAIQNGSSATLILSYVTLASNTSAGLGGGLDNAGSASYDSTIFAGNTPNDCHNVSGTTNSNGYNLFGANDGCLFDGTGDNTGDAGLAPLALVPLEDGDGETYVHELLSGSDASDKIPSDGTNGCGTTVVTDQRGETRPLGAKCEIGAIEVILAQPGPIFVNNTISVEDDGVCGFEHCSLREAIEAANNRENDPGESDQIHFNIPGSDLNGEHVILVTEALPPITEPVIISGTTQVTGTIVLDGSGITGSSNNQNNCNDSTINGLTITGANSVISGLEIRNFPGDGVAIGSDLAVPVNGGNTVFNNDIHDNSGAGVCVNGVLENPIRSNTISTNTLGISLLNNGNMNQQPPTMTVSIVRTADFTTTSDIGGFLLDVPGTTYDIDVFSNPSCTNAQGHTFLASTTLTTDETGLGTFLVQELDPLAVGAGVTATATDPAGNTSEFSSCKPVEMLNDSWLMANPLSAAPPFGGASASQVTYQNGQAAWFRFPVEPDGKLTLTVNGQPGTIVTLHRNLFDVYKALEEADDPAALAANDLSAGFLPPNFLGIDFLAESYLPPNFLPDNFLPDGILPDGYLAGGYLSANHLSVDSLPPNYLPPNFLPPNFLPPNFLPPNFLPPNFLDDGILPALYSGAVRRGLVAVSYNLAASEQTIEQNTWDLKEEMYAFVLSPTTLSEETTITVTFESGLCAGVGFLEPPADLNAIVNGSFPPDLAGKNTLIVWDSARMLQEDPSGDMTALAQKLNAFASESTVNGVVIDLAANGGNMFPRVTLANTNADDNPSCVSAKNEVATEIKRVIDAYRAEAEPSLEYVTLVGSDFVIPYFRYPDEAGLGNENNYIPPVGPLTQSEAALRRGQVLGQDAYGASHELTRSGYSVPLPELAVGRLVRTAEQVMGMIEAYEATDGLVTPGSALATGYDFVADAGQQAQFEFTEGLTGTVDSLITPQSQGLNGAWDATALRDELFDKRHDMVFMAGHFTAGSLVAADYQTQISASEVTSGDFENSIILGLGCHGGYNVPEPDAIDQSPDFDWPEIFLAEKATLVASTGYAYGDTDLLGYGELLFLNLIQQLRSGEVEEVAIGKALVAAKLDYFTQNSVMTGIDDKTVLETTLFGFPMLRVNMLGTRITLNEASIVSSVAPLASGAEAASDLYVGQALIDSQLGQMQVAGALSQPSTIQVTTVLTPHVRVLTDTINTVPITVTYFEGGDGVVTRPAEPLFPLESRNVEAEGYILRGVGFYGAHYTDIKDVTPWTSAPSTENSRSRPAFFTEFPYPSELSNPNYVGTVSDEPTWLHVTAGQYKSDSCSSLSGTMRLFDWLDFRLFYLPENWAQLPLTDTVRLAAVAAGPVITNVSSVVNGDEIQFSATVQSDLAAPVQAAWVTWTDPNATDEIDGTNMWQSFDLQDVGDGTVWVATIPTTGEPTNVPTSAVFMVQAVNAGGLVSQNTNDGVFYTIGQQTVGNLEPTTLNFLTAPTFGAFGEKMTFKVELSGAGPVDGQQVILSLGGQRVCAKTDSNGRAALNIILGQSPGDYALQASFRENAIDGLAASTTETRSFEIKRDTPLLTLESLVDNFTILSGEPNDVVAVLTDSRGKPLPEKTVAFMATSQSGTDTELPAVLKTDPDGRVALGVVDSLASGTYVLKAKFIGFDEGGAVGLFDDVLLYNSASATANLTVNSRPVADAGGPYQVDEGSSILLDGSGSTDEGSLVSYDWVFDHDGSTYSGSMPTFDAADFDGPLNGILTLTVTDNLGVTDVDTTTVTIDNVAPVIISLDAVNDPAVTLGISASADFSDAGIADTHTAQWDWGDGTSSAGTVTEAGGSGTVAGSHTYDAAGFYTIKVTITDDDGGQVEAILPDSLVYEAGVGKVSGGGRVSVPSDACGAGGAPYCTSGGNANFGWDVQYIGGNNVPEGQTTFNFKSGSLNFSSVNAYDTLVVIDDLAIFWGQGTLSDKDGNVEENVYFKVTAIDADIDLTDAVVTDRVGIKIWYFDNSGQLKVVVDTSLSNLADEFGFGTLETSKGSSVKIF